MMPEGMEHIHMPYDILRLFCQFERNLNDNIRFIMSETDIVIDMYGVVGDEYSESFLYFMAEQLKQWRILLPDDSVFQRHYTTHDPATRFLTVAMIMYMEAQNKDFHMASTPMHEKVEAALSQLVQQDAAQTPGTALVPVAPQIVGGTDQEMRQRRENARIKRHTPLGPIALIHSKP